MSTEIERVLERVFLCYPFKKQTDIKEAENEQGQADTDISGIGFH